MGSVKLIHGDCLTEMKAIPDKSIDLILCDPPYGTTVCGWDIVLPMKELWEEYRRVISDNGTIALFGIEPFASALRTDKHCAHLYRYDWLWVKNRAVNFAQAPYMPLRNIENIMIFSKATIAANSKCRMKYNPQDTIPCHKIERGKAGSALRPNRKRQADYLQTRTGYPDQLLFFDKEESNYHPTQKPIALLDYLIKTYTVEGDAVLDNTMGSGSTGVACVKAKMSFIGIELNDEFYNIAQARIAEAQQDLTLF